MTGITKQQAATVYGNNYKLQDKEGVIYKIRGCISKTKGSFLEVTNTFNNAWLTIDLLKIGKQYFILARPLEQLTQTITHEGKEFVPIVELAKVEGMFFANIPIDFGLSTKLLFPYAKQNHLRFCFYEGCFGLFSGSEPRSISNQQRLFSLLYEYNFAIIEGIPIEYYVNLKNE